VFVGIKNSNLFNLIYLLHHVCILSQMVELYTYIYIIGAKCKRLYGWDTNSLKQFLINKQQLCNYVIFISNFEIKRNKKILKKCVNTIMNKRNELLFSYQRVVR